MFQLEYSSLDGKYITPLDAGSQITPRPFRRTPRKDPDKVIYRAVTGQGPKVSDAQLGLGVYGT